MLKKKTENSIVDIKFSHPLFLLPQGLILWGQTKAELWAGRTHTDIKGKGGEFLENCEY